MSHTPEQPWEVPYREVEHEEPGDPDAWPWEAGRYAVGSVRDEDFWGWETQAAEREWWAERKRKSEARKALGGFGFCAERVNPPDEQRL